MGLVALSASLNLYNTWSSYESETDGVAIFYTSVYGHTKEAATLLYEYVKGLNCPKVTLVDLAREDMAESVEDAFRYSKIVLATTTYNSLIFPYMETFLTHLIERNFQNKKVAFIENGTWAPTAAKIMKDKLSICKNLTFIEPKVTILSSLTDTNKEELKLLANNLCQEYIAINDKNGPLVDNNALFNIGYGLYVITTNDGKKDNGLIVNAVTQLTNDPNRISVCINKMNYSHNTIKTTKKMNVNVISETATFDLIKKFGFSSGRDVNKFEGEGVTRSSNGLVVISKNVNAYISLEVEQYIDMDTHGLFICSVKECKTDSLLKTEKKLCKAYFQTFICYLL